MQIDSGSRNLRLFGALFIAATLAGCGQSDEKPAPKAEIKTPPPAAVAPKPEPKAPPPAAVAPKPEPKAPPIAAVAPRPAPQPAATPPAPAKQAAVQERDSWRLLGQQRAEFKRDRDRMVVGTAMGAFREIQLRVQGAPLELDSVVVTFGNGEQFKPAVRHQFNEKSSSRAIDLPGERRAIQHVDFIYRSPDRREGAATVQLYGR